MKAFVKRRLPPRLWSALAAVWSACRRGRARASEEALGLLAQLLLLPIRLCPARVQASCRESLHPVRSLDYQPSRLLMSVSSSWAHYRLKSAAKEPETVQWITENMRPGDVFYDVGANVGAYSLIAYARGGRESRVYAFEPAFETFRELCENVRLNKANQHIVALHMGLGAATELLGLSYSELAAGAATHSWQARGSSGATPGDAYVQKTCCFRLDDIVDLLKLEKPSLIKIDVDGPEYEVLVGAGRVLEDPHLRSLLIEVEDANASRICDFLRRKGFSVTRIHRRGATWCNYVFHRGADETTA